MGICDCTFMLLIFCMHTNTKSIWLSGRHVDKEAATYQYWDTLYVTMQAYCKSWYTCTWIYLLKPATDYILPGVWLLFVILLYLL